MNNKEITYTMKLLTKNDVKKAEDLQQELYEKYNSVNVYTDGIDGIRIVAKDKINKGISKIKKIKKMTIREALLKVITSCPDEYAKSYARAGLELGGSDETEVISTGGGVEIKHKATGKIMIGEELKVQLLYVLSNAGNWRGEEAREVKKVLKSCSN